MPRISSVLLETTDVVIENSENNKNVKVKSLLDQSVEMTS